MSDSEINTTNLIARAEWLLDSSVQERMDAGVDFQDIVAELVADLNTHRDVVRRFRDGYVLHRSAYDTTYRWHLPGTPDTDDDPMTPEQFRVIWPEEQSDG